MDDELKKWLVEGEQSKITSAIKKIVERFEGEDLEKVRAVLRWIDKNIPFSQDYDKIIEVFAKRTADEIIKDGYNLGCHDTALLAVTFFRAMGIPSKFVQGISKLNTSNTGHCVVEAYLGGEWVMIDPGLFEISLDPKRSTFYKENYITGKGLDSWDIKIKSFEDWKNKSNEIIKYIENIN